MAAVGLRLSKWLTATAVTLWSVLAAAAPVDVLVATVQSRDIADPLEALGTLRANEAVAVTVNVAETVESIGFRSGQRVKQGQVLLTLESAEERALVEEAESTRDEARAQLERIKTLAGRGDASQSLLDENRREFRVAEARLAAVESRLQNRIVKAPFAGVVGLRNISPGAYLAPGDLVTTLVDDRRMKLDFNVPSLFLTTLKPGVPIVARSRALADRRFEGEVASVDNRVDPVSRSVTVRAILDNPNGLLRAGMLMEVTLQSNPRAALVIPESALVQEQDRNYVYVLDQSDAATVARRQPVTPGLRLPGTVEIREGLQAGQQVVLEGAIKLRDGSPVKVLESPPYGAR
ncbi:MAG: efflux RND transporter periplasmic adaptor subunit [Pseudomonadota bacterium]|nr:efflux RND transporter periplasmic adaptor subunit [Pseudomonadota bacterium]